MGFSGGGGSGGVSLPIVANAGDTLARMGADGNLTIGGGAKNLVNLILQVSNLVGISGLNAWIAAGPGNGLLTSRQVSQGAEESNTVGAAGAAPALPAQPLGYWIRLNSAGNPVKIPYYNP